MEKYLELRFSVPVKLCISEPLIDDCTAYELFRLYNSLELEISETSDILFDITHSFRSIPILVYQALQFTFGGTYSHRNVELVYGEFVQTEKVSYVRNLCKYWEFAQVSDALNVFKSKLDGFRLAQLIKKEWEKGSKAIKKFSEIVQTNFALQIFDVVRQIKAAILDYPTNAPSWLSKIREYLESIVAMIDENNIPRSLYRYSEYLYEHQLNVQAVITLQVAVESSIVMKYGEESNLGDYDWLQKEGKQILYDLKGKYWKEMGNALTNLEFFRNQVAHGGGKNKGGSYPHADNIPNIYKSGKKGIDALFKYLEI